MTLLYSTILFLSKEAFDRACLSRQDHRDWRQIVNLLWCTVPLASLCASALGLVWIYLLDQPVDPYYISGVVCFAVATIIEVLAEPLFVVGQAFLFVKLKVFILGISQGIKCVIIVIFVLWKPHWGIHGFAIAQIVSSIAYTLMYHGYFILYINSKKKDDNFPLHSVRDLYPQRIKDKYFIDTELANLTWSFFQQSFFKQILTEGEKYVMTFFDVLSYGDQGIYDIINNLGSLAARLIFLNIEESSFLYFSQTLTRGLSRDKQDAASVRQSSLVLGILLKAVTLMGAIILVFGFANSELALHLYGGAILSEGSGPTLLRWYCLYVLFIAINGTSEAFVFAAMSKTDVDKYNRKMLLFSVIFLFSSWLLTQWLGSVGFILANCLNMAARIVHSLIFIHNYFKGFENQPLHNVIPAVPVLFVLLVALLVTAGSEITLCVGGSAIYQLAHIFVSAVCLLVVITVIYFSEKELLTTMKGFLSHKGQVKKKTL